MSVHEGHRERLRKRFLEEGLDHFTDIQALELVLFYCVARKDTNPIAHALLDRFGSLAQVLEAPVEDGTFVGYVAVLQDGYTLATFPLYTVGNAERSGFMSSMKSLQALTSSRAFLAGAIFFVVVLIAWISIESWIIHRKRHKWDKYFSMKMSPMPMDKKWNKK